MPRRPRARTGRRRRVLVLWNSVGDDEIAVAEGQPLPWDPTRTAMAVTSAEEEVDAIVDALRRSGFTASAVNVRDNLDLLQGAIHRFRPDAIFNLVEVFEDRAAREGHVAALLDLTGVPYTGAGPLCLQTCQRKYRTKILLEFHGVPTPPYRRITRLPLPRQLGVRFPLIVKPAREDASDGIHADAVVRTRAALEQRVRYVLDEFAQPALVERYIEGREIHAAVLGNEPPEVLPLLEMEFEADGPNILTYEAKWDPLSRDFYALDAKVPARLPRPVERRVRDVALAAYRTLECRDYARIDLRLDEGGAPYVLEVNPNPDLSEGVGFMQCAERSGRSFDDTIAEITQMALARGSARRRRRLHRTA